MGNRLQELRVARGIDSQRELAHIMTAQVGVPMTFAAISRLESGETKNPYYGTVHALAKYFGVSTDYLMGECDEIDGPQLTIAAHTDNPAEELPPEARIAVDTFYNKMKAMYAKKNK